MKPLYIFDSIKKEKLEFIPIKNNNVKIYVCGPTVYDDAHLGHARSAIAFDMLHRVLIANNYNVTMTKNFTDIDDKIIKKMYDSKKTLKEITTKYMDSYKNDLAKLNVLPNTLEPKATDNLDAMINLILILIEKEIAYKTSDGIYFNIKKDLKYGSLSKKNNNDNSFSRVELNKEKINAGDFALWKFEKDNDVVFEAPFGNGRPGWHTECSAMIEKHIAYKDEEYQIDIHAGGADLLFPHHENEASQTRCAFEQNIAKYWMHNAFVKINDEKMSKSLGNSFFLKDILNSYDGETIRFYLLSAHYRTDFNFSEEDLQTAKKRLDKLYRLKKRVYQLDISENCNENFEKVLIESLNDDLNTAKAFSVIDDFINNSNDKLDQNPKDKNLKKEITANINLINKILGIGLRDAYKYFQFGINDIEKNNIELLINERNIAKKDKNFKEADKIREKLNLLNVHLMDTANGTVWEKL